MLAPFFNALFIVCQQVIKFLSVTLLRRSEHANTRMDLDAHLLLILRNRVPDLCAFFELALSGLPVVAFRLRVSPFREPQGISTAGRLGWLVLGPNDDC